MGNNRTNSELKPDLDLQVQNKTQSLASVANLAASFATTRLRK